MFDDEIKCPYCGVKNEVAWSLDQYYGSFYIEKCESCQKYFKVNVDIDVKITPKKFVCANNGLHKFILVEGHTREYWLQGGDIGMKNTYYELCCINCNYKRMATNAEKRFLKQSNEKFYKNIIPEL